MCMCYCFYSHVNYSVTKNVETIVHEETHLEYNLGSDAHAECACEYNALKH